MVTSIFYNIRTIFRTLLLSFIGTPGRHEGVKTRAKGVAGSKTKSEGGQALNTKITVLCGTD